jgi:hypothetical protein
MLMPEKSTPAPLPVPHGQSPVPSLALRKLRYHNDGAVAA